MDVMGKLSLGYHVMGYFSLAYGGSMGDLGGMATREVDRGRR